MMRALAVVVLVGACSDAKPASPVIAAAGHVVEVSGAATIANRPLRVGDVVASTDVIDTGADGAVSIELAHNHVRLALGPNQHVRVDQSLAWREPMKQAGAEQGAATTSAGRAVERSAAETTATTNANADNDMPAPAPPSTPIAPPPTDTGPPTKAAVGAGKGKGKATGAGKLEVEQGAHGVGAESTGAAKPQVAPGSADIHGGLTSDDVQRVIRRHASEVRACYERSLGANPTLRGKVVVTIVIDKDGVVTRVQPAAESTLSDEGLTSCIVGRVKTWTFPPPEGGGSATVTYPFAFAN